MSKRESVAIANALQLEGSLTARQSTGCFFAKYALRMRTNFSLHVTFRSKFWHRR